MLPEERRARPPRADMLFLVIKGYDGPSTAPDANLLYKCELAPLRTLKGTYSGHSGWIKRGKVHETSFGYTSKEFVDPTLQWNTKHVETR